ncbi:hypothetical protein T12_15942 [Trichinella patagoniensis]|uniref:Uncharacterized protein n=1 Tax=Trichinella patagoniensis TaxID=990121 RepID=A0A0V1A4K3_9BILA|nr:hypothetical protein T12_15942 [Trichinella patagoniensis]
MKIIILKETKANINSSSEKFIFMLSFDCSYVNFPHSVRALKNSPKLQLRTRVQLQWKWIWSAWKCTFACFGNYVQSSNVDNKLPCRVGATRSTAEKSVRIQVYPVNS